MESSARKFLFGRAERFDKLANSAFPQHVDSLADAAAKCLKGGGKSLAFGNGGSAALAQHLTGELVGRFLHNRPPLPAIPLTTDTSTLTAIGNDFSFDDIFARQIEAHGRKGDLALALTTSGNSQNVVLALRRARDLGLTGTVIAGRGGGLSAEVAEIAAIVGSDETDFIQEAHEAAIHYICHRIEAAVAKAEPTT